MVMTKCVNSIEHHLTPCFLCQYHVQFTSADDFRVEINKILRFCKHSLDCNNSASVAPTALVEAPRLICFRKSDCIIAGTIQQLSHYIQGTKYGSKKDSLCSLYVMLEQFSNDCRSSKVITRLQLLRLVIGLKISRQFINQ